jgi:hypothetical protein
LPNGTQPFNGEGTENSITLKNGAKVTDNCSVFGASLYGCVSENKVVVNDGSEVDLYVYGGWTYEGNATSNSVVISGGSIRCGVYGGYGLGGVGTATRNNILISGGSIGGNVYGGYVCGNGEAVDNRVEIRGNVEFGENSEIYGGIVEGEGKYESKGMEEPGKE